MDQERIETIKTTLEVIRAGWNVDDERDNDQVLADILLEILAVVAELQK